MVPDVNHLAVILAVVASMVVGFAFYHPAVLGRRWMGLVGHDEGSIEGGPAYTYPLVVLASLITAWVLAGTAFMAQEFYDGGFMTATLWTGWILWLGFTAARVLVHDLFDTRSLKVTALTALNELLTITAMALVIGAWPPAGAS